MKAATPSKHDSENRHGVPASVSVERDKGRAAFPPRPDKAGAAKVPEATQRKSCRVQASIRMTHKRASCFSRWPPPPMPGMRPPVPGPASHTAPFANTRRVGQGSTTSVRDSRLSSQEHFFQLVCLNLPSPPHSGTRPIVPSPLPLPLPLPACLPVPSSLPHAGSPAPGPLDRSLDSPSAAACVLLLLT